MEALERAGFLAHSQLPAFRKRVIEARGIITQGLTLGLAHVANGWGKDSTVMTHLVQSLASDVPVVFFADPDEEGIDNYRETADAYLSRFRTNYYRVEFKGDTVPEKTRHAQLWRQWPVVFVGVRAEESPVRKLTAKRYGPIHDYQSGEHAESFRVWPLIWWTWRDVWAYIVLHDLPYLASYDSTANRGRDRSRTCNLIPKQRKGGPKGSALGRIALLRERQPEYFNYLVVNYPEIARLGQ